MKIWVEISEFEYRKPTEKIQWNISGSLNNNINKIEKCLGRLTKRTKEDTNYRIT